MSDAQALADVQVLAAATTVQRHARGFQARTRGQLKDTNVVIKRKDALGMVRAAQNIQYTSGVQVADDVDYMQSEALLSLEQTLTALGKSHVRHGVRLDALESWPALIEARLGSAEQRAKQAEARATSAEAQVDALGGVVRRLEAHLRDESRQLAEAAAREAESTHRHSREISDHAHRLATLEWRLQMSEQRAEGVEKRLGIDIANAARHAQDAALQVERIERSIGEAMRGGDAKVQHATESLALLDQRLQASIDRERGEREDSTRRASAELYTALSKLKADSRRHADDIAQMQVPVSSHARRIERMDEAMTRSFEELRDLIQSHQAHAARWGVAHGLPHSPPSPPSSADGLRLGMVAARPTTAQWPLFQSPRARLEKLVAAASHGSPPAASVETRAATAVGAARLLEARAATAVGAARGGGHGGGCATCMSSSSFGAPGGGADPVVTMGHGHDLMEMGHTPANGLHR